MKKLAVLCVFAASLVTSIHAQEGPVPRGIPHLDHVFVIMMENHGYNQILNNSNAPFINQLASSANLAENYFAIGHPSLTNYLEVVGGSNFGVRSDDYPNWHSATLVNGGICTPNLSGSTALDYPAQVPSIICPITGSGMDAATPAIDCTNEVSNPPAMPPNCYLDLVSSTSRDIPAASAIGKTIADQLVERGKSWKSYQENLPITGADGVNISDGFFTNNTEFSSYISGGSFSTWTGQGADPGDMSVPPVITATIVPRITTQKEAQGDIPYLYAVKHNPFVYFENVQEGADPRNSLQNVVGFDGASGLFADLASNSVPNLSFIAPNQCNDMHGRGNAGPFCNYDASDNGTQTGLNETLIKRGDVTIERIVLAIESSEAWHEGNNAIVVLWDENDYTATPNHVMAIVVTNKGDSGEQSRDFYTHFSLLKSLEAGFGLPCLNHACDRGVETMSDLFGGH